MQSSTVIDSNSLFSILGLNEMSSLLRSFAASQLRSFAASQLRREEKKIFLKLILFMIFFFVSIYNLDVIIHFYNSYFYLIRKLIIIIIYLTILYLFIYAYIILHFSLQQQQLRSRSSTQQPPHNESKDFVNINNYYPKFLKNYLLHIKKISSYEISGFFIKTYLTAGIISLIFFIILIILII